MGSTVQVENVGAGVKPHVDIEKSLGRYAKELRVSLDHVIMGTLKMAAEEYDTATGKGIIPCLF